MWNPPPFYSVQIDYNILFKLSGADCRKLAALCLGSDVSECDMAKKIVHDYLATLPPAPKVLRRDKQVR